LIDVPVVLDRVEESGHRIGRLGAYIGEPAERVWVSRDVFSAVAKGLERTWEVMQLTVRMLGRMVQGQASWDNLSGPLSMAEMAGKTMAVGWGAYVAYLALLSVSLGVFNLLPLPVLDGGQLMYYLYEFLTGHPPAARWHQMLQQTGVALLMALMVFAIFNDLARLGWLP
jgi:regulator of sigma E protease